MTSLSPPMDTFVSLLLVSSDQSPLTAEALRTAHRELEQCITDFEIVVISNRSQQGRSEPVNALLGELSSIRIIKLAYPVAFEVAMSAALENCIGDFVVLAELPRDPTAAIITMVKRCRAGADVLIGTSKQERTVALHVTEPLFDWLLRKTGYLLPKDATTLRCLSRRAVIAVTRGGRFHHTPFVRMTKTGYPVESHPYDVAKNLPAQTLGASIREVLRLIVFNSTRPMRWITISGVTLALAAALFAAFLLPSTAALLGAVLALILALLFLGLGFLGEYVGRLLDERSEEFFYMVAEERNSSLVPAGDRLNVASQAEVEPAS